MAPEYCLMGIQTCVFGEYTHLQSCWRANDLLQPGHSQTNGRSSKCDLMCPASDSQLKTPRHMHVNPTSEIKPPGEGAPTAGYRAQKVSLVTTPVGTGGLCRSGRDSIPLDLLYGWQRGKWRERWISGCVTVHDPAMCVVIWRLWTLRRNRIAAGGRGRIRRVGTSVMGRQRRHLRA